MDSLNSLYFGGTDDFEVTPTATLSHKRRLRVPTYLKSTKKRDRGEGARAAVARPVQADYDSDDARIIHLKQTGYTDAAVSEKLKEEGRTRYEPKTISSRYIRLRRVIEQARDEELDDELTDWHDGEDEQLLWALNNVEHEYELELEKVKERLWRAVSTELADRLHVTKYSAKACRERYEGLSDGTALPPIEEDSDQEGRRIMRETRIASARRARAREANKKTRAQNVIEQRRSDKKSAADAKLLSRQAEVSMREARRVREEQIRDAHKQRKARIRAARQKFRARESKEVDETKREKDLTNLLYSHMTGRPLRRQPHDDDQTSSIMDEQAEFAGDEGDGLTDEEVQRDVRKTGDRSRYFRYSDDEPEELEAEAEEQTHQSSNPAKLLRGRVMPGDPPTISNTAELQALANEDGVSPTAEHESHAGLDARRDVADQALDGSQPPVLLGKGDEVSDDLYNDTHAEVVHGEREYDERHSTAGGQRFKSETYLKDYYFEDGDHSAPTFD